MKYFKRDDINDLRAIIEELVVLEKRLDALKLKIDFGARGK